MNANIVETVEVAAERAEAAEVLSFVETIAALAMESADCYSEI